MAMTITLNDILSKYGDVNRHKKLSVNLIRIMESSGTTQDSILLRTGQPSGTAPEQ